MITTEPTARWTLFEKIIFRFLFLFLGFFLLNYELAMASLYFNFYKSLSKFYALFGKPLQWLDAHFYHIGYNANVHESMPSDNHYGAVFYLTALVVFLIITLIWSLLQRHKEQYNKLYYWFRLYVRCMVALIMFGYGMDKLIPSQMAYPDVEQLLTPIGNQSRYETLWNFIGSSPAYEIFTGTCEVIASILLIFRRTYIFGCLLMCAILCNVVALNFFYNIPVKMYSSLLLFCVFFLLIPYTGKLIQFFFKGRMVTLAEKQYRFQKSWKKYVVITISVIIPLLFFMHDTYNEYERYNKYHVDIKNEKLFDITTFIVKDTLAPLITDTIRWKRFAIPYKTTAAIFNMQDKAIEYDFKIDSIKHTYIFHDNDDSLKWDVLHYQYSNKNTLEFTGKWKGNDVHIIMKEMPVDSMTLNKDRITFLNE